MLNPLWLLLTFFSALVFLFSLRKAQNGQFFQDTFWLVPLGIYIWGDGLIIAPFWLISNLVFLFLPPVLIFRFLLLFYLIRSTYEVIYWLFHQSIGKNFKPPLLRHIQWLGPNEGAILYQLFHIVVIVVLLFVLLTFNF